VDVVHEEESSPATVIDIGGKSSANKTVMIDMYFLLYFSL